MGLGSVSWAGGADLVASDADLVMVGRIVTMAAGKPNARGPAVKGGKIAFVGDAAAARKRLRPGGRLAVLANSFMQVLPISPRRDCSH